MDESHEPVVLISNDALHSFKDMIKTCPLHVPPPLIKGLASYECFIRWAKHDVAKAATRWTSYWTTRLQLFGEADITSPDYIATIEAEVRVGAIELPNNHRDLDGRQVLIVRMRKMDYTVLTPETMRSYFWFVLHKAYEDSPETLEKGIIAINDMNDLDKGKNIRLQTIKYLGNSVGDVLPVRVGGVRVVRQPWFFSAVFSVLSPFLPSKLVSRVKFLGNDLEALKETFPASSIPTELGGTLVHDHDAWVDGLLK
mmetsp:Transcript_14747/g.30331  ORF Transcript_14747/g.30331 Transcript_14747/m.30331 type:complete len:255 (-) Transcript_14747:26-790(-)